MLPAEAREHARVASAAVAVVRHSEAFLLEERFLSGAGKYGIALREKGKKSLRQLGNIY